MKLLTCIPEREVESKDELNSCLKERERESCEKGRR